MNKSIFILIILFAVILRFIGLDSLPAGFNADEAALGYNAYSLLLTGRDEHGHPLPVNLESFGDHKPALYSYLLIPLLFFGLPLTEVTVRLPSAVFGTLCIVLIYYLAKILFASLKFKNSLIIGAWKLKIEDMAALLLAISPWHIHFSRGAWEVNVATTLICLFAVILLRFISTAKTRFLTTSLMVGVLSMYAYQSARIIFPALVAIFFLLLISKKFITIKTLLASAFFVLGMLVPLGHAVLSTDASSRLSGVGLLADEGPLSRVNEMRGHYQDPQNLYARAIHNKVVAYSLQFVRNYLSHFEPTFLFISGDKIDRSRTPETGQFHLFEVGTILLGLIIALKYSKSNWQIWFIFIWIFCAPLASALTFQTPHALRSHNLLIPLTLLSGVGAVFIANIFSSKSRILKPVGFLIIILVAMFSIARYWHQYTIHSPYDMPTAWQYGFREVLDYVAQNSIRYEKVIMTNKSDQPYILFLFYLKYPPSKFQGNHSLTLRDKFNFSTVERFDKFEFTNTEWSKVRSKDKSLIITFEDEIVDPGVHFVKTINYPNGQPAFKIISN